ncbi:hypothetical protein FG379_003349 [Cryptosporidium bovis]|uniref:uncharacterized protein n=1 Tax=Cryptosporidium bovis TaxID=310047 RepID=UPI003519D893|nr:hypothetical protein FG379_003349 [Cryptosporidium bovis]
MILNEYITTWPKVDCLISFYSLRFPLVKTVSYSKLNNLEQVKMKSRLEIYNILDGWKIPRPKYIIISHERPTFSENHNNWIHYSENTWRGCKNLSRKLVNISGEYDPNLSKVRREEAYMYEEFLPTFETDVKVNTVDPMFTHAEGKKICGFDILRTNGKSVVCDVNSWSFAKGSGKYYNDCACTIKTL